MTWSDPRGYDPLVAASAAFHTLHPHVTLTWDKRSLQEFETTPIPQLAARYDLMVIDHPHVGAVVAEGCLVPLDRHAPAAELARLHSESLGRSYISYFMGGAQWALPIDAAAQVQALRIGADIGPLSRWAEVMSLAQSGDVVWPLRPPHVLMSFFTLCANLGDACATLRGPLVARKTGQTVLAAMAALAQLVDPACFDMDPIAALDALSTGPRFAIAPHCYLYAPYAQSGYRPHRIAFHDIPAYGAAGPLGSALGGTGIAISAQSNHPQICTDFALWLASAPVQRGLYAAHNGQPGNARAWGDGAVNAAVGGAYAATRMTHEAAWLRPRHAGYMAFQETGSAILTDALRGRTSHSAALDALDAAFDASFTP